VAPLRGKREAQQVDNGSLSLTGSLLLLTVILVGIRLEAGVVGSVVGLVAPIAERKLLALTAAAQPGRLARRQHLGSRACAWHAGCTPRWESWLSQASAAAVTTLVGAGWLAKDSATSGRSSGGGRGSRRGGRGGKASAHSTKPKKDRATTLKKGAKLQC
jgi:hypothetical protein